jgi:uncharacterized protein (TIGR03437 family)
MYMRKLFLFLSFAAIYCSEAALAAQADRIAGAIDSSHLATLPGHTQTLEPDSVDAGSLPPSQHLDGLVLFLKPSPPQQTELDQLLINLHDPASALYHQWLTPEEYADRFAISAGDAGKITAWLASRGFHVGAVARGRSFIIFDGMAEAVESTFHPAIHLFRSGGDSAATPHYANTRNPSIPAALQNIVRSIGGLDDFVPEPLQSSSPEFTSGSTNTLAPGDFPLIYDFASLLMNGTDGTGQKIVIVGETSILQSDIQAYRTQYNLPSTTVQVILVPNFPDPGMVSANLTEADLDLEVSGAVARNATLIYVYTRNAYNAAFYAIDQALAPVINFSFTSGCDTSLPASMLETFQSMAQQGVAEGITWLASSGDSAAAGCDAKGTASASKGLATQVPADIPEITAVGGTMFNDANGNFWSSTNDQFGGSATGYIPEAVWNNNSGTGGGGGGVSAYFLKPSWQAGPGVPADGHRDVPDVAFSASGQHDGYRIISNGSQLGIGGTSASSPLFAGMVTLLSQYLVANGAQSKPGLGNLNTLLYRIAQSNPSAFHDVTTGNNIITCTPGTPDCTTGRMGYSAGPGYDLCTGLGSVDLQSLASAALAKSPAGSLIVVSSNANPVYQQTPNANGFSWSIALTLTEEAGVPTTLTGLSVDGKSETLSAFFTSSSIAALGSINTGIGFNDREIPQTHVFAFTGADQNGRAWSSQVSIPFVGFAPSSTGPVPSISGSTNAASFAQSYAPGMILSIFGSQLSAGNKTVTTLPLPDFGQGFEATVNGVLAPIYYVSPTQANVQIPYGTAPGPAELVVYQAGQSAATQIQISAAAPGIFADGNGNTVPYASGSAGQTLVIFITGDGEVAPALATGTAPPSSTPIANLPQSILPLTLSIGGQSAQILFNGIPYGLVGVTQLNFVVPSGLTPGPQQVVVTVGTAPSKPATFTITN